jgi:hypothetical protein
MLSWKAWMQRSICLIKTQRKCKHFSTKYLDQGRDCFIGANIHNHCQIETNTLAYLSGALVTKKRSWKRWLQQGCTTFVCFLNFFVVVGFKMMNIHRTSYDKLTIKNMLSSKSL